MLSAWSPLFGFKEEPMARGRLMKTSQSRLFTIEDRAGPSHSPVFQSFARMQGVTWDQGDITRIRRPDPNRYGGWITTDRIRGAAGDPNTTLQFRLLRELSSVLKLVRKGCAFDAQLHIGACKDPQDFNLGWEKVIVLEGAEATSYGTDDLGALDQGEDAVINENVPIAGEDYYEIKPILGTQLAETEVTQEIIAVAICDSVECGECGRNSDGCQRVFAATKTVGGSPGAGSRIVYSKNGGALIGITQVTTMGAAENMSDLGCVGPYLVAISADGLAIHYAVTDDIIDDTETWTKTVVGLVAAKTPQALFSLGRTFTWIVAAGGYIYFSSDITAGATSVQTAGAITTQQLNDIHGIDELNLVAVGASNAVLVTTDGGITWAAVTGPAVGVALNTVWMKDEVTWFIGDAGGNLWYTTDAGITWAQKRFSGDGAGVVRRIKFATPTVGYMSHDTAAPRGRIFRTIDGGNSWYALPETGPVLPLADRFNDLAVCGRDPNLVYAGGLEDDGVDGMLLKIA